MKKVKHSFWHKLMFSYVFIIMIPLLTMTLILYTYSIDVIERQTSEYKSSLIKRINEKIDTYSANFELLSMAIYQDELQTIMNEKPKQGTVEAAYHEARFFSAFDRWMGFMGAILNVKDVIWIQEDQNVYSRSKTVNEGFDFVQTWWYQEAINRQGAVVVIAPNNRAYAKQADDEVYFTLVRKINNTWSNRADLGVLVLDIKFDYFEKLFAEFEEENLNLVLYNQFGELIYSHEDAPLVSLADLEYPGEGSVISEQQRFNDVDYFITRYDSPKLNWSFLSLDPLDDLKADVHYVRDIALTIGIATFVIVFLISIYQSWRFVRPIRMLQKSMRKFQHGEFEIQTEVLSYDEVGELTESFNEMTKQTNELISKVYQSEINEKKAQLSSLQAQINPHFLYNTLDMIHSLSKIHRIPEIGLIAKLMSDMFRYNTDFSHKFVTLSDEIKQVLRYTELVSLRYDNKIHLEIDLPSDMLNMQCLKFTLQPIVENAVKHGLEMQEHEGIITIRGEMTSQNAILTIEDNGSGMEPQILEDLNHILRTGESAVASLEQSGKQGIGLLNVLNRLRLHYGKETRMDITSQKLKGTEVKLMIPN